MPKNIELPKLGIVLGLGLLVTILFLSLYSVSGENRIAEKDYSRVQFSSKSVTNGLPNSVVFDFNLLGVNSDSLLIQQYWDPAKTIIIEKNQMQATGQYYYPGYFRAKLLVDREVVKEHDLFIKTDKWLGTIDYEPIPKYIDSKEFVGDNLSFSKQVLDEIKSNSQPLMSSYHYINELKSISGDNFILETAIRNAYNDKWAVCEKAYIYVIGTRSAYIVPFSIPGCISEIGIMLSDVYVDGKKQDLSTLGHDLTEFRKIKIETIERNVKVYFEAKQVFTGSYNETIGAIVGVRFRFLGAGEVAYLNLEGTNGIKVFDNSFHPILK